MTRHDLAGFFFEALDRDSPIHYAAAFGSVGGDVLGATQNGLVSGVSFDVLIEVNGGQVALLNEYIRALVDLSLLEASESNARAPHGRRRQRRPSYIAGTRSPRYPGWTPDGAGDPIPAAAGICPAPVVEWRPAPVVSRNPGPSVTGPDPVSVGVWTPTVSNAAG